MIIHFHKSYLLANWIESLDFDENLLELALLCLHFILMERKQNITNVI